MPCIKRAFQKSLGILSIVVVLSVLVLLRPVTVLGQDESGQQEAIALFNQGQDAHEKDNFIAAIEFYDKALTLLPEFPEAEFQKGSAYLSVGNSSKAEVAFRRALELREEWTLAMTALGSVLLDKRELKEADKLLSRVIELEPLNPAAVSAIAELRLNSGASEAQLRELLSKLTSMTEKANPTVGLWSARAAIESKLAMRAAAKLSLNKALSLDPKNRQALFLAASEALAVGDIDRAKLMASRLDTKGSFAERVDLLNAVIAARDGDIEKATALLNKVKPDLPEAIELRSAIAALKNTDPAELEKQLETNAADPSILGRLCVLYRRQEPTKAIAYCRRASEAEPENMAHAVGFGAALVQAKQYDAASSILRKLISIDPENATARANLATALFQMKRYAEAKTEFEWLTSSQPKQPTAYFFLGIIHDRLTEYIDAMANYQQYLKLADSKTNLTEIEQVNLRLPLLQNLIKAGKGKKSEGRTIISE